MKKFTVSIPTPADAKLAFEILKQRRQQRRDERDARKAAMSALAAEIVRRQRESSDAK